MNSQRSVKQRRLFRFLRGAAFVALALTLVSLLVMVLWNNLIPELFAGPRLNFGQALGLLILTRLLFMGFRPWGWGRGHRGGQHWRRHWQEKLTHLTPEERERFKQAYAKYCGKPHRSTETPVPNPDAPTL